MKRTITFLLLFAAATSLTAQTSCGTVKDNDGNTYATVQIGEQCWMKENLRTTHFSDGTAIPAGGDEVSLDEPYYYDYSNSNIPLSARGYLYNWTAAMNSCPKGWHLPSDAEWTQLTDYVGSRSEYVCGGDTENIAKALASNEYWESFVADDECVVGDQSRHTNNATGFSAVPAGYYSYGSSFNYTGFNTSFWSSSQNESCPIAAWSSSQNSSPIAAWYRYLSFLNAGVGRYGDHSKSYGRSVRCLRD